ncbi:hypothetical protein COE79_06405 [Bacillus toyonensis]|nr:hypothetical protein COE79_06405 [Bacillus toyonensis]
MNIESIITKYIYIEKFITKLAINDSKLQCKLLFKSLLSFPLKHWLLSNFIDIIKIRQKSIHSNH